MNSLVIANTSIRTDAGGRFCLNDLHRAAGAESKHQPAFWLRSQQTRELIDELNRSADLQNGQNQALAVYQGGNGPQGTYVAKELVYAYAMWISAAFHLKVIRAYDATVSAPAIPQSLPEALRLAADLAEQKLALEHKTAEQQAKIAADAPKVKFVDRFCNADGLYGLENAARALNVPPRKFIAALYDRHYLHREGGVLVPYAAHREMSIFLVKATMVDDVSRLRTYITPKGLAYFAHRLNQLMPSQAKVAQQSQTAAA